MLLWDAQFKQIRADARIIPKPMKLVDITTSQPQRLSRKENILERQGTICHCIFVIRSIGGNNEPWCFVIEVIAFLL